MSGSQENRTPAELWSLQQAAVWVEVRADVSQPIHSRIAPASVKELHEALKAGRITGTGCVDAGERRTVSPAEWNDYRLTLKYAIFPNQYYMGSSGVPLIAVLSIRSFPARALKSHQHKSEVQIPSANSPDGETGYQRVIDDVLLRREEVAHQWPAVGRAPAPHNPLAKRTRRRPASERAQKVIMELFPDGVPDQATLPNSTLRHRVTKKLKDGNLLAVSDDTILRAAGRRRT
jgi:hypothetical protein